MENAKDAKKNIRVMSHLEGIRDFAAKNVQLLLTTMDIKNVKRVKKNLAGTEAIIEKSPDFVRILVKVLE